MPSILGRLPRYSSAESTIGDFPSALLEATLAKPSKRRFSHHRTSRTSFESPKSNRHTSSSESLASQQMASLDFQIESPPLVCFGSPTESMGALLAGMLWLCVGQSSVNMESLTLVLERITTTKKPVSHSCSECVSQVTTLQKWDLLTAAQTSPGEHNYPFSFLFDGKSPATSVSGLGSIRYQLVATGKLASGESLKCVKELTLSRSILPGPDKQSLRIFPPTELTANLNLPSVIHKATPFNVEMQLNGLVNQGKNSRWRLRKLVWRIDETTKVISQACKTHNAKIGGEGKGVMHTDVRTLACTELKKGWKTDFSENGRVELDFECGIPMNTPACNDVEQTNGLSVSHNLVVEMIVAEEFIPKNTKLVTPTGAARVLRMQFKLIVTDHSGLGVSWEEECPPLYENVPGSPPTYNTAVPSLPEYESISAPDSPDLSPLHI